MKRQTLAVALVVAVTNSLQAQGLPEQLAEVYEPEPDLRRSDEFNGRRAGNAFDESRWHFRESTKKGLGQGPEFVEERDGKLIAYGRKSLRKAGGIVSNEPFQFGWYGFRWRTTGMPEDQRSAWHPSIWGSWDDTRGNYVQGTRGDGESWMEIDILEFVTHSPTSTFWGSDAPAYIWDDSLGKRVKVNDPDGRSLGWEKAIMFDGTHDRHNGEVIGTKGHGEWQTWGMEYHPDYLQMWKLEGDQWVKVGNTVTFTDDSVTPTERTVPKKAVKPLYWYLGNLFLPHGRTEIQEDQITNSTFEIDWFRYHPLAKEWMIRQSDSPGPQDSLFRARFNNRQALYSCRIE